MKIEGKAQLVKIFIGENDQWHGKPLYDTIVQRFRKIGIAGATVTRGIEGYGAHSRIHTARILRISENLPIQIEIVDIPERISQLLPVLKEMVTQGLITIEDVHVVKYVPGTSASEQK